MSNIDLYNNKIIIYLLQQRYTPGTRHAWHAVFKVSLMGGSPFYRYKMRAVPCHVPDPRKIIIIKI